MSQATSGSRRALRRLALNALASALVLLPQLQGFSPATAAPFQATPFEQRDAPSLTSTGQTPDLLGSAVASSGAPDEHLDVSTALDRGVPRAPAVAAAQQTYDHWMADLSEAIGQRPLRQVVIPGSHDAATYGGGNDFAFKAWGNLFTMNFAQAQSWDINDQLNRGSRYFDIRASWENQSGQAGPDYWISHGSAVNGALRLSQVLGPVGQWANQPGHAKEIVILSVLADPTTNANSWQATCQAFLNAAGHRLLQPNMLPPGTDLSSMTMDDLWALPNQPTIIANFSDGGGHNWSSCTLDQSWPAPSTGQTTSLISGFYANQCAANGYLADEPWDTEDGVQVPGVIQVLGGALANRMSATDDPRNNWEIPPPFNIGLPGPYPELVDQPVGGLYVLYTQATPVFGCLTITATEGLEGSDFAAAEQATLAALKGWYLNNQNNAQQNLNIIAGDFIQDRGIVDLAIELNWATAPVTPGLRVQAPGDPAVYLIDSDGTRRHIPNQQTYTQLFGDYNIEQRPVSGITAGPDLSSGAYLATSDAVTIYLVTNGEKRWITSPAVFGQFAFNAKYIRAVDQQTIEALPDGPDLVDTWQARPGLRIQAPGDPAVYLIDSDGTRRHIPDPQTYTNLFGDYNILTHSLSGIPAGPDLSSGAYLAIGDGPTTYLVTNGEKRWITTQAVFNQFAFNGNKIQTVQQQTLEALPNGPNLTGKIGALTTPSRVTDGHTPVPTATMSAPATHPTVTATPTHHPNVVPSPTATH
jgi:hypothetical protein